MRAIAILGAIFGLAIGSAGADEIELRSGVVLDGQATVVGDEVKVVLPSGGQMTLPKGLVKNLRQDGAAPVGFSPTAAAAPPSPLPAFAAEPVPIPAGPPGPVRTQPTYVPPVRTASPVSPATYPLPPMPTAPPPSATPPGVPLPGGVYERQGLRPSVMTSPAPVAPCAAPAAPCAPCAPDPCDPCDPPCPDLGPWSITLDLSWTQAGGNSDSLSFKVDFELLYEKDPWTWVTKGFYAYAESGRSVDTNRIFVDSQLNRKIDHCSYAFANLSYDQDEPAELEYRLIGNLGYGRSIIKQENMTLDVEAGVGATWQKRRNLPEDRLDPSALLGVDFMRDWGRAGKFTFDYDFLPNLNDFDLTIQRFDVKYSLPIWKCLNIVLGLRVDWQLEPEDPGVEPVDWITSAGIGITF